VRETLGTEVEVVLVIGKEISWVEVLLGTRFLGGKWLNSLSSIPFTNSCFAAVTKVPSCNR